MKTVGNSSRGRSQGVPKIQGPMYMAHRAVIFATAQLSCDKYNQASEPMKPPVRTVPEANFVFFLFAVCKSRYGPR